MSEYDFSDDVRHALTSARETAFHLGHHSVDTEHLALGLFQVAPLNAARVLVAADSEELVSELKRRAGTLIGPTASEQLLPLTIRAQHVLSYTMEECRDLHHESVEIAHLVLGLLREEHGVAAQVLRGAGVTLESVRAKVRHEL